MIEKPSAHYQEIPLHHMRCGNCAMMPGSHCTLVRGVNNKNGWCRYWMPPLADRWINNNDGAA